jgi:hypothetical protein
MLTCCGCLSPHTPTGSDGTYNFWDKDSKQRLKAQNKCMYHNGPAPIPCSAFNRDGTMYAYAVSACCHIYSQRRGDAQVFNCTAATASSQAGLHPAEVLVHAVAIYTWYSCTPPAAFTAKECASCCVGLCRLLILPPALYLLMFMCCNVEHCYNYMSNVPLPILLPACPGELRLVQGVQRVQPPGHEEHHPPALGESYSLPFDWTVHCGWLHTGVHLGT